MAILSIGNPFGDTDTVTSTKLNNIANQATFDDPVDGTTLEKHTDGKLRITPNGVGTTQIATGAVITDKITNNAVTLGKLASGVVSDNYISGGIISPNSGSPTTTIDVTKVDCISSDGTQLLTVSADSINVTANASWASGTAPTLTDLSVHLWADYNAGSPRYLLDNATGSNITGAKRRVASFLLDGSGQIIDFDAFPMAGGAYELRYDVMILDLNDSAPSTSRTAFTLSTPPETIAKVNVVLLSTNTDSVSVIFTEEGQTDTAPTPNRRAIAAQNSINNTHFELRANSSSQAYYRSSYDSVSVFRIHTIGFIDERTS